MAGQGGQGGGNQPQSLSDGLKKVHSALADLKLSPQGMSGPGGQFIDGMMQAIQQFVAQQAQATIGGGQQGGGQGASLGGAGMPGSQSGAGGGGSPFGAPPSQPMMGQGGGPAGGPASMVGLMQPPDNMDEIGRMLSAGSVNP